MLFHLLVDTVANDSVVIKRIRDKLMGSNKLTTKGGLINMAKTDSGPEVPPLLEALRDQRHRDHLVYTEQMSRY